MDLKEQIRQKLTEEKRSKGFGDTFEKFTTFTGIKLPIKNLEKQNIFRILMI